MISLSEKDIQDIIGNEFTLFRAMPNTAMKVGESMTCLAAVNTTAGDTELATNIFNTMGQSILINEDMMSAATALCACGIAFFLRTIRAASQGGVEIGFAEGFEAGQENGGRSRRCFERRGDACQHGSKKEDGIRMQTRMFLLHHRTRKDTRRGYR